MTTEDMQKTNEKFQKLMALAYSSKGEEGRTAAAAAAKIFVEEKLVVVSEADMQRASRIIEGQAKLAKRAEAEGRKNLFIGLALGFFGGKRI